MLPRSSENQGTYSGHRVESDSLKANQVVSGWDRGRNGCRPGAVLLDHQTSTPEAIVDSSVKETSLVDFELRDREKAILGPREGTLTHSREDESADVQSPLQLAR